MFSAVWNGLHWGLSSEQTSGLLRLPMSPLGGQLYPPLFLYIVCVPVREASFCSRGRLHFAYEGGFILLMSRLPLGSSVWTLWTNQLEPGSFLHFQLRQRWEQCRACPPGGNRSCRRDLWVWYGSLRDWFWHLVLYYIAGWFFFFFFF